MGQGIWRGSDNLSPEDTLKEVIKQGTLTVGFIGISRMFNSFFNRENIMVKVKMHKIRLKNSFTHEKKNR